MTNQMINTWHKIRRGLEFKRRNIHRKIQSANPGEGLFWLIQEHRKKVNYINQIDMLLEQHTRCG